MSRPCRRPGRLRLALPALVLPALVLTALPAAGLAPARPAGPAGGAAGAVQLVVEPDAGIAPIYHLLASAQRSLELVMYELEDPRAEQLLAAEAGRGVVVRVLLDGGYERAVNQPAFAYLASHHVAVRWSSSRFEITHEKAFVVDSALAVVMTLNLVPWDYPDTRDLAVVDHQRGDVAAVATAFADDWVSSPAPAPAGTDLVWSPGASGALLALIASARHLLLVENEEMGDPDVVAALAADARRGVAVEVTMTADPEWDRQLAELRAVGVRLHVLADESGVLYIHAKAIVVDPGTPAGRAFVGSQNFSVSSLVYNRELGLITTSPPLVSRLAAVLEHDFASPLR